MGSVGALIFGAFLGASLVLLVLLPGNVRVDNGKDHRRSLLALESNLRSPSPNWNGVLPENIVDQQLPSVRNPHYGLHVIALGKNGSLFHKYQIGSTNMSSPVPYVPMSDWICLTPNASLVFGNSPAVALNADGRIELFVGYKPDSLDLWQMYQTDPRDPLAWSEPRAPYCDPAQAPCRQCIKEPNCVKNYWSEGFAWTTSQQSLWLNPDDKKLRLTFRNFDGYVYEMTQGEPSNSDKWPVASLQYAIFE
eukprot:TRINITY_DN49268_c0_g1_i1.p1 TRINITY_DN49268_c0_g1~~TRINITY_DN49268_c0_g1_i1.p1  ORF type:complete len:250 (-),score=33.38 TRINITY_DN49268_c0_g1_i1:69-818(-)